MPTDLLLLFITVTFVSIATCTKNQDKSNVVTSTEAASMDSKSMTNSSLKDSDSMTDSKSLKDSETMTNADDVDLMSVMMMCNESFRIEMSYLMSLNDTGSFPDEFDKTPKCFLRCVLESLGIASLDDGKIDPERASVIFFGEWNREPMEDILEMATYCAQSDDKCRCEMAYKFLKCFFSMEIDKHSKS